MRGKGLQTQPILIIEAFVTTMLIVGIMNGIVARSGDYIKQETLDVQADKVVNAALAMDSIPQGGLTIPMADYGFRYDGEQIWVAYENTEVNHSLSLFENSYNAIEGPSSYRLIEQNLLVSKTENSEGDEILQFEIDGELSAFSAPAPISETEGVPEGSVSSETFQVPLEESASIPDSSNNIDFFGVTGDNIKRLYFSIDEGSAATCGTDIVRGSPITDLGSSTSKCAIGGDITTSSGQKTLGVCEYDQSSETVTLAISDGTVSISRIAEMCGGADT